MSLPTIPTVGCGWSEWHELEAPTHFGLGDVPVPAEWYHQAKSLVIQIENTEGDRMIIGDMNLNGGTCDCHGIEGKFVRVRVMKVPE